MTKLTYTNPDANTWDNVAISDYSSEIQEYEYQLAKGILGILHSYGLKSSNIIETGSGSGHLSALLAQKKFNVTLVDYSIEAIKKSKELFQKLHIDANFFQADITILSKTVKQKYDIVFSSGVLEHFDDEDLLKILTESYKVSNKYLIFLVPNPKSLPYLLFRMKAMKTNKWLYGKEYLRDDYEVFIEKSGFKLIEKKYVGMEFSRNYMNYVFENCSEVKHFNDLVDFNLIPQEEAYLTAFIAIKEEV